MDSVIKTLQANLKKSVERASNTFATLHTGRASATMVEGVTVAVYGSPMKLKELATITTPDARTILIQPWDQGTVKDVEKAILTSNLGFTPLSDGGTVRCSIPALSQERRKELAKMAQSMAEEGRISVRAVRREGMDSLKKLQKEGSLSEDELKRFEKEVQKHTDQAIKEIDSLLGRKEKELLGQS